MPDITHRDNVSATNRREHSSHKIDSAKVFEFLGVKVIPSSVVHPLSQEFDWRLSSIFFFLRHVEIVNKDDYFVSSFFRPILALTTTSADFAIDESLDLVGVGLSRKGSVEEGIIGVIVVEDELVGDIDGLAGSGGSAKENMEVIFDVEVEKVVESDGVIGWNQEVVEADFLWNHKRRSSLRPVLPNKLFSIIVHVEDIHLVRHLDSHHDR